MNGLSIISATKRIFMQTDDETVNQPRQSLQFATMWWKKAEKPHHLCMYTLHRLVPTALPCRWWIAIHKLGDERRFRLFAVSSAQRQTVASLGFLPQGHEHGMDIRWIGLAFRI